MMLMCLQNCLLWLGPEAPHMEHRDRTVTGECHYVMSVSLSNVCDTVMAMSLSYLN